MSNKTRILESALKLFNEQGSMHVSTNHIATEAGISPGNLYYHFHNKEEIILALFQKMIPKWDDNIGDMSNVEDGLAYIEKLLGTLYEVIWEYRFIHRELSPLLQTYESVREICVPMLKQRLNEIRALIHKLQQDGVVTTEDPNCQDSLANTMLFIPLFWLNYLDAIGETPNKKNIDRGINMMRDILAPHLAPIQ
jgi:AcrR family transcriptional regulator